MVNRLEILLVATISVLENIVILTTLGCARPAWSFRTIAYLVNRRIRKSSKNE